MLPEELDIVFVRHGVSCGNLLRGAAGALERDPPLCTYGARRSRELGPHLDHYLNEVVGWRGRGHCLAASALLRAQETAAQLFERVPVNVFPHIGESGVLGESRPRAREEQRAWLARRAPAALAALEAGADYRDAPGPRANLSAFLRWLHQNLADICRRGKWSQGPLRMVLVSHRNFLRGALGVALPNDGAVRVRLRWDPARPGVAGLLEAPLRLPYEPQHLRLEASAGGGVWEALGEEALCPDGCPGRSRCQKK